MKKVRCAVDVDLDTASFNMTTLAGELETAQQQTDDWIRQQLASQLTEGFEVFCGTSA